MSEILSRRPSGMQTVSSNASPSIWTKFSSLPSGAHVGFAKGSESWHLRSSLCSLISLPQDTWRRHMLMRTNSPAAHVIRGREFYLNFGSYSNIQCGALKTHILTASSPPWSKYVTLASYKETECSVNVTVLRVTATLTRVYFVCVCSRK